MADLTKAQFLAHLRACGPCLYCQHYDADRGCALLTESTAPRLTYRSGGGPVIVDGCRDFVVDFSPMVPT